jgi:hypothetical protein
MNTLCASVRSGDCHIPVLREQGPIVRLPAFARAKQWHQTIDPDARRFEHDERYLILLFALGSCVFCQFVLLGLHLFYFSLELAECTRGCLFFSSQCLERLTFRHCQHTRRCFPETVQM